MSARLLRSTAVVGLMTLLSRLLGFVRDMAMAYGFGAGNATDAFLVAFRIPNFLRRLFAEGAFALAFVPVFSEYRSQNDQQALRELVDRVSGTLALVLLGVTTLGVLAAPWLIGLFAYGFADQPDKLALSSAMLRITFPYLLFISLTALAGGILNSCGRFALPAFTPVILNVCLIGATVLAAPYFDPPIVALAWGVFLAGALQLAIQLPALWRIGLLPRPRWGGQHPGVQRIGRLMLPTLFGSSVAQINLLFDTFLASLLIGGSVSWLYYADRLMEFPLGLLGVALGTVILPQLSKEHATASTEAFSATLDWALRSALVLGLPAALALGMLAVPLLATLFGHGAFTDADVLASSHALIAYACGLLPFMLIKVLAPGFYARQDTATPVRIGIQAMVANMVFNLLLIVPLAHAGLALATSLSAALNAGLLWWTLRQRGIYCPGGGWKRLALQLGGACIALGAFLYTFSPPGAQWLQWDALERITQLGGLVVGGMGVYALALLALGLRPRQLWRLDG